MKVLTEIGRNRLRVRHTQLSFAELEAGVENWSKPCLPELEQTVRKLELCPAFQVLLSLSHSSVIF